MFQRICLVAILFIFSLFNVYASNNDKIITNMDSVYNNFRDIQKVFTQNSVIEAIEYYDKYFVQSYQFLNKRNIDKSKLLSQMLEDEKCLVKVMICCKRYQQIFLIFYMYIL